MEGEIRGKHLQRRAYVYVRQSSPAQVLNHQESSKRQYQLQKRAFHLGWPKCQIEVIDEDQGQSGASADNRKGFQRLISEVALGEVGAVFGLEISRLARSCADWYRLMEVAALASTLIIDEEGWTKQGSIPMKGMSRKRRLKWESLCVLGVQAATTTRLSPFSRIASAICWALSVEQAKRLS